MPLEYKVKCAMLKGHSINVKSPALATGAVIVDLPGVHDANAARAAVAEGYSKLFSHNVFLVLFWCSKIVRRNNWLQGDVLRFKFYVGLPILTRKSQ